ncbi:glycosyltransferase family 2 protein [Flavobacterium sp. GSP27]|uniref:Glycosyltransferase family 2 protein n=1 Tax=Flavobacterium bomense TaxID=2497483 RepID=A0A432CPP1_9FLAO|nr:MULTISPECIES: glycosyltransferase family 2 protein [Flavobacterium]RTY84397.1 glycosyltransferase family 2 protein [Flavobacterium sp. LS1P28]RTZ06494.1 glycosyltransferase family 2 protein [Flavobacterium bomense]RTZ08643.1 glycosyltransferase family 2 protein [Flavobacterium sp. GSP6]RTZ09446.1 glycosyltransferase family 2 protein [Flavobacterium sp. GSP27]
MLAIVIPYYKITFFEATIESLADQTDKRFKVYIGDDASTENPGDLLEKYKGKFEFVYHRFERNLGGTSLVLQWERCIALSNKEEWIMILGDDDYLSKNVVFEFYENYNLFHENCNVLRYSTRVIDQINGEESKLCTNLLFETGIQYISRKIKGKARGSLSEFVFNKNEFLKHKFTNYPSAFYSDDKIVLDLTKVKNIFSTNSAVVFVRISSESLSGKAEIHKNDLFLARFEFFEYLIKIKYYLFDVYTRKIIVERFLSYTYQHKKQNVFLFLNLYLKSVLFLDFNFFMKINKKFIKIILGQSID